MSNAGGRVILTLALLALGPRAVKSATSFEPAQGTTSTSPTYVELSPNNRSVAVTIYPGGTGWTVVAPGWLKASPFSGASTGTVTLSYDPASITSLTGGYVMISSPGASNDPYYLPVNALPIQQEEALTVTPSSVTFNLKYGNTSDTATLSLDLGPTALQVDWGINVKTFSGATAWLTASAGTSVIIGHVPPHPTITASAFRLDPGTYTGMVEFTASPSYGSVCSCGSVLPADVAVTLVVSAVPKVTVAPSGLTVTANAGSTAPPQTLQVKNAGNGTLNWSSGVTIQPDQGKGWLSVGPASGAGDGSLTVQADATNLAPGKYWGVVWVFDRAANPSEADVRVDLTVNPAPPKLTLSASTLPIAARLGSNPAPVSFDVKNSGGGALGWTATTSGGDWLKISPTTGTAPSTITVTANSSGLATGTYNGTITVTALASAGATNSPQTVAVTLVVGAPAVADGGIVNGASFAKGDAVSPGSLASLFGTDLAAGTAAAGSLPLPTTLASTQVLVNGTSAPLFYVSPAQINFQVPVDVSGNSMTVQVSGAAMKGNTVQVPVLPLAPGIFLAGSGNQGVVLNEDSSLNSAAHPAAAGSVLQIFATGLGATNPPVHSGEAAATSPPFNLTIQVPTVLVGGVSAEVLFSGLSPGFAGLYQVNARVPQGVSGPAVTLQVNSGGKSSNAVTIAVQ